jgi:phenylacetate-CoA ligase
MAAGKVDPMEVYKRIPVYNFNIVLGEPTWLIKLTELAEKHGSYPLKFIIAGAEEMPDAARPWMEKVWQGAKVRMVYASVESSGIIGFEPFDECGRCYHIDENGFLVEITDPDSEGYGEVTFTTLLRKTMPLIRYRNRDISRLIEGPCACGLPFRRLAKMRGRADELIVASGGNLYPLMFEDILKTVDGITNDWQVVFKLRGIKELMEFNLELKEGADKNTIEKQIFDNIKTLYPDLWKNYAIQIFEIVFSYHSPRELRGNKNKLLRILDQRYC